MTDAETEALVAKFKLGWRKSMDYETEFHALLGASEDPHDGDPCEGIYGPDDVTWPAVSYLNRGDSYTKTLLYDHAKGMAMCMSIGDWLGAHPRVGNNH